MIELTGDSLTIEQVAAVACNNEHVAPLSSLAQTRMEASRAWVRTAIYEKGEVIYGINTGFGPLAGKQLAPEAASKLSRNVILACLVGVGDALPADVVRAMMLTRANTLLKGYSGIRPVFAQTLIDMLNAGVTPLVPGKGSLGASGDLAPLAHIAVVLTRDDSGDGGYSSQAWHNGTLMSGAEAMARAGINRLVPEAKEGLALTNGTTFMVAAGALAVHQADSLVRQAEIAAGLSLEALTGLSAAFHAALHDANNQPGQMITAANLRALTEGSRLMNSASRVQDAYSLRCTPQVIGPVRDTLMFLRDRFTAALNAASDNPLIFPDADKTGMAAVSGGNFHGQGPSMWMNFLSTAISAVGNIAERRVFRMLTPELNNGLPSMLVATPGLDSGLMMPQYTAAALVSDNKTLAHPDSVDSIPSSGNQEDHVSMGANSARHTLEILANIRNILAIELLTAAQGIDLRPEGPTQLGRGTAVAYQVVRRHTTFLDHDRELTQDINLLANLIASGDLLRAVRDTLGEAFELMADRELWLEKMTWTEIQAALAEGYDTAIIFTGSIEQHGPHLPISTDTVLGYALGERVARKLGKALLVPVVRPGISEHHMAFKGTVSLSVETFKAVVRDYAHSLARHGFRRIAITWSHGGNVGALKELLPQLAAELPQTEILGQTDLRAFFKFWVPFAAKEGIDSDSLGIHAGEGETSMMLAYVPDEVRGDKAVQGFMGDLITGEGEHTKLLQLGLHVLTDNGVLGDARHANRARGERYLDLLAGFMAENLKPIKP